MLELYVIFVCLFLLAFWFLSLLFFVVVVVLFFATNPVLKNNVEQRYIRLLRFFKEL